MMTTPVTKLTKILDLEAEKYRDQAVVGGLASYVPTWTQEARRAFGPKAGDWIDEIAGRLRTYSALPDTAARREALVTLRDVLNRGPARAEPAPDQAPKPAVKPSEPSPPPRQPPDLESPITVVRGIGPKRSQRLQRLGVHTIRDLLYFLPRRYDDYSQLLPINRLKYGQEVTIIARVKKAYTRDTRGGRSIFKAILTDGTGSVEVTWFNQPYLANQIKQGQQIVVSGEVDEYLGHLCFTSPQWEPLREELLHTNRIVPVYPLTEGLTARSLRRLMKRVVTYWSRLLPDYLPRSVVRAEGLLDLETAILQAHFPSSQELLKRARQRLAFDELFVLQVALLRQRHEWRSEPGQPIPVREDVLQSFVHSLPYELTEAQQRSLEQIVEDLQSERPMTRLLQGDVGSGKTVVAAAAMALTASAGSQAAMMAPTEILAEQHYRTVTSLLDDTLGDDIQVRLLTGSVTGEDRDQIYAGLENGTVGVVVGTHALIQESVTFDRLALAVVDEQHRFGVRQRGALRQKGYNPHLLVMTATPIPRSLQLTVWGHLDVSVIDQMPPGRKPVVTRLILPTERERAY
ncbi:MAG: ATP-dependent DNA helicase RecG, partial [Anaerolineae bacterium]